MCWITYARSARGGGNLRLAGQGFPVGENVNKKCYISDMIHHYRNKKAFTLAEVLITLGIIGVVAALTLPSLINKYKIKQLHTAFTRTSSILQNVLNETAVEFGYNNFKELNSICGNVSKDNSQSCRSANQDIFEDISSFFSSRFKTVSVFKSKDIALKNYKFTNYSNSTQSNYDLLYGLNTYNTPYAQLNILADGTAVTSIAFFYHEPGDGLSITFDTNGPEKGPNRYGYDIFLYNTGTWTKLCTKKQDGGTYNGRGCYDYALKDINPDDNTKGYWSSLY